MYLHFMKSKKKKRRNLCSFITQLYCFDITDCKSATWEGGIQEINKNFDKS